MYIQLCFKRDLLNAHLLGYVLTWFAPLLENQSFELFTIKFNITF